MKTLAIYYFFLSSFTQQNTRLTRYTCETLIKENINTGGQMHSQTTVFSLHALTHSCSTFPRQQLPKPRKCRSQGQWVLDKEELPLPVKGEVILDRTYSSSLTRPLNRNRETGRILPRLFIAPGMYLYPYRPVLPQFPGVKERLCVLHRCCKSRFTVVSTQDTEFILVLLFINYCITFLMNKCRPTFATYCIIHQKPVTDSY